MSNLNGEEGGEEKEEEMEKEVKSVCRHYTASSEFSHLIAILTAP